ncbi:uncharacterized protein VP01_1532g8, partial [Puccinia sorghi]
GSPPPRAPSSTAHPLAHLPEQFDGTHQFPDDCSKIIFMLTNLSGDTTKWAQPLNQWVLNKSDPDVTPPTLAEFITSFNGYFLNLSARVRPRKTSIPSSNWEMWIPTPSSSTLWKEKLSQ